MPLKIVTGRAGSGKSSFCISEIKKIANDGGKAIYIVPKQFTHEAESQLISSVGFVSDRILATSFKRLSSSVLKASGKSGIYADNRVKCMLMAKTLLGLGQKLKIFATAGKNSGYIQVILDVIAEFKKAVLSPDDIITCSEKITDNDFFAQKIFELGIIYKEYTQSFDENLIDAQDTVTLAAECINKSDFFSDTHIFIDEFFKFTKQELMFISALLERKCDVTVALSCDFEKESGSVFNTSKSTLTRLIDICKNAGDSFCGYISTKNSARFASPELIHLEREGTKYPPKRYEKTPENISLFAMPDIYSEIVNVAAKISHMVKKEGYLYSEISVIAGNFERYAEILGTVFADYDIPVFVDNKKSILNHPIMLTFFSVFDIIQGGFNTKDVLTYIKTGLSPISAMEADALENHVIKAGVKSGDWLDDTRFTLRAKSVFDSENELSEEEKIELLNIKNKVIFPIKALKERLSQSRKVFSRVNALMDFFEQTDIFGKIVLLKDELEKTGRRHDASEYASVYNILIETLKQTAEHMGSLQMGMERLKAVLSAGFGDLSISVVPTECEQVLFGAENRTVVKNVRALFIIGANSGAFPAEILAGGILSDSERVFLQNQGFEISPDSEKRIFDAKFMVYNTLSIPKERLNISYSLADIDGKGLRPSQLVASLTRIFPKLLARYGSLSPEMAPNLVLGKKSAYNYVVGKMASGGAEDPLTEALKNELIKDSRFKEKLEVITERIQADMRAEKLAPDSIKGLYGDKLSGSVSRFEKFSQCPFSYFVQYGLGAKERKVLAPEATDTGSLLHEVIEIFSKRIYESGRKFADITDSECLNLINEIIDELLAGSFIERLYSKNKLDSFIRRLKSLAGRSALANLEHVRRGKFEPCAFEFSFDENGDTPPITLTLPNGAELSIVGKIDRVDSYKSGDNIYIKIIDYKSGRKKFSLSDVYNRLSLQLTVYLTAFIGADSAKKPAGMFYFRLTDPVTDTSKGVSGEEISEEIVKKYKMSGLVLSEEEIIDAMESGKSGHYSTIPIMRKKDGTVSESMSSCADSSEFKLLEEYVNKALCDIGNEIFSGNVEISPVKNGKQTACDYCDYASVCGAGKYIDVEFRNALSYDKAEIFNEMKKAQEEQ